MANPKKMSQLEKTRRHKELHPEDEAVRKERQRHKDNLLRFHIRRKVFGIPVPPSIDQGSEAFKRAEKAYLAECAKQVEVSE